MTRQGTKKRVAVLTPEEDKAWVFAFCYYKDSKLGDLEADRRTWRDMLLEFPRLKRYGGCR
jgi:hypothetical protein